jgi:EF-P beta-lysylation protein EpmB
MITEKTSKRDPLTPLTWQQLLDEAIRDPNELLQLLQLDPTQLDSTHFNPRHFPLRVPKGFIRKMHKGDWNDPLLKQILPLQAENNVTDGFHLDPVGDQYAVSNKGILKKYHGRALIITTGACAIHCRYCFRQNFPYSEHKINRNAWADVITDLETDSSISEVILSGGDPLSLSDKRLSSLCFQLAKIPHINTIRFHTRLPLVLPERIDHHFLEWFQQLDSQKIIVIHANHANEFCKKTSTVLEHLHQMGTILLNQSVLLKGINDNLESLTNLSNTLIANKVIPYYLHLLDKAQGTAHFDTYEANAIELMDQLRKTLPGYSVPKLVREVSGKRSKTPIN